MLTRGPSSDIRAVDSCAHSSDKEVETIRELIDRMSRTQPEASFLIGPDTGRVLTFRGLQEQARTLSAQLRDLGLERGDKVAFLLENGLFTVQLFLGAMYGGFVVVPLNVRAGVSQLSYVLDHCDAKVVFVADEYASLIFEVMSHVGRTVQVIRADIDSISATGPTPAATTSLTIPAPEDPALLMYTSGSTGQPKAAVHSHRTLLAHGRNSVTSHQLSAADRSLLVLPLYHINAECVTLIPTLLSGGSVVVPHRFSVSQFWDWLDEHRCTWSALVPTIIAQLVEWKDPRADQRGAAFQRIRFLRSSSAPLAPSLHQEFLSKFPLLLIQAMGSSEAGNIFSNPQPPGKNKIGSPGLPWGFEVKIVDQEGVEVAVGESGEIIIRGPAVMQGYYKEPEATAAVLGPDGWLFTGDLAYRDEDGYFFVVGRSKELIIKGGVNIAPRQIDEVLESHPAVREAAAVGVPDRYLGEDLVAFVVLRTGVACDEKELLAFCESRLGHFKTPTRIHFAEDLPKGPSGKAQRLRLRDEAAQLALVSSGSSRGDLAMAPGSGEVAHPGGLAAAPSIEQIIAETWREVLPQAPVDPESNFFALGGHSLLAMQCVSLLREKIPVALSLSDFFENATVAQQAALVRRRLPPDQGQALTEGTAAARAEGLQQKVAPSAPPSAIPRRDPKLPCPLSTGQRRLWFIEQLNPGLPLYNEAEGVRLLGELNVEALERALNVIVARHEGLRTTIHITQNEPLAVVHESWPLQLKKIDLSAMAPADRRAEVERLLIDEPRRLYRLETEPGIRATLIRLAPREHVFILMMHHIFCDRSSLGVLWRELAALYPAFCRGESLVLPPLPIHYGDYAVWQQQGIMEPPSAEDLSFWRENLRGAPELLELPADRPRPPTLSYRGAKKRFRLNPTLTQALRDFSQREKTSLFNLFTAAFNTLLYRYTGQEDILLGIPIAERERPELQSVIGFLVHTCVLRTPLSGDMTFRELLALVQKETLELYRHRAVPFDVVVRELRPERNQSHAPLFQVMINWRDRGLQLPFIGLEGLVMEPLLAESRTSKLDLTLFVTDGGDEIWLEMEYSADLFDEARISRMFGHYQTLMESLVSDPGQRLAALALLTAEEQRQLLVEWNQTRVDYPKDMTLHELFEAQAERTPGAVAVEFAGRQGNERLTYSGLNSRSTQFARHLQALGVGPDVLVAVYVDRSLEMVIALLGILKAGGAYLPLDLIFPPERIAFMLGDAQPRVLVTLTKLLAQLPPNGSQVVCIDDFAPLGGAPAAPRPNPRHLAYLLYTSGSTGKPKGVEICHRAVVNFLNSMRAVPGMAAQDTLVSVTTLSFDIFGLEVWLPLTTGAKVVIVPTEVVGDGRELAEVMQRSGATVMQATPATWRLLLESGWEGNPHLKILCGGEAWPPQLAEQLLPKCAALWNMYGPTETTIWSSVNQVQVAWPVLIGPPIANTQFYVIDSHLQPVPVGVPGELLIGGEGLARGYRNRPELTAERFIANPFSTDVKSRLYRTGDLVRYLPDGNIEFLGRMDHQVKIRGFRIELEEIENVLRAHPGVSDTVVIAREEGGNQRLVAYIVPSAESEGRPLQLRDYLKAKLPNYMVPTAYVMLEKLPLTPNGKVDRKALPIPDHAAIERPSDSDMPRDMLEQQLTQLWRRILGMRHIRLTDDFFDLGGHSLAAARLFYGIERLTGKNLPLATLFQASTVEQLADVIRKGGWSPHWSSLVPINPGGSQLPLFLVHGAEGNVLLYRQLARYLGPEQPVYGFQSQGLNAKGTVHTSIEEMASHYLGELVALQPSGPYRLGGYCLGGTVAFEMAQQLQARGERVGLVAMLDTYNENVASHSKLRVLTVLLQDVWFHGANFWLAGNKDRWNFFREKWDVELTRARIRLRALYQTLQAWSNGGRQDSYPHLRVKRINDQAELQYVPRPYSGRVAVIRPIGSFWGLDDPSLGWSGVVRDGLEIRKIPVYPKGMLVEPFVQRLAQELSACLKEAK